MNDKNVDFTSNLSRKHLQKIGSKTDNGSESTSNHGSLVGRCRVLAGWWWWWVADVDGWGSSWAVDWWWWCIGVGDVGVGWVVTWFVASTWAVSLSNGRVGLGASAWAVADGQSGSLSHSVGNIVLDNGGWVWAVGGILSNNLGGGIFIWNCGGGIFNWSLDGGAWLGGV